MNHDAEEANATPPSAFQSSILEVVMHFLSEGNNPFSHEHYLSSNIAIIHKIESLMFIQT